MDDGMNSDLQGHRERTDDVPAHEQVTWVPPLDFRASSLRRPRPSHRRGLRDLRLFHAAPRWPAWHQPHRPQPYRGMFPYYPPSFNSQFCLLVLAGVIQFDAILVDYLHKRKLPKLGPLFSWMLRLTSVAVGMGVYQFNTNDIGAYL